MLSKLSIRATIIIVILLGIGSYTAFEFEKLWHGPVIEVTAPESGTEVNTPVTSIKGRAKNIARISMNDRDISVNSKGEFEEKIVLSEGNNIIKLAGVDRFGHEKAVYVEVLYNDTTESAVAVR